MGFFQRPLGLAEYLRGNQGFVIRNNPAGVYHAQQTSVPVDFTIEAVARGARLIAPNRSARPRQPVVKRRFSPIGPPNNGHQWGQRLFSLRQYFSASGSKPESNFAAARVPTANR